MTIDLRYASVVITDAYGEAVFQADPPYRISFSFHNGMDGDAGEASIRVYGLDESDAYAVINKGVAVALSAGNEVLHGTIFTGDLIDAVYMRANQESYLSLSAVDGDGFYSSYVLTAIGSGESLGGMLEKVVRGCSSPVDIGFISPSAYKTSLPRGISAACSPVDLIKAAARSLNAAQYVYQSRFYLVCPDDSITSPLVLDYENGIIGVPSFDNYYALFQHDVDSALMVGRFIMFPNDPTRYRIATIDGSGDTKEGPWELNITAIAQDGSTPKMTAVTDNIWR